MKTYNEMANSALQRIEEHEKMQRNRRKLIAKTVVPVLGIGVIMAAGIAMRQVGKTQGNEVNSDNLKLTAQAGEGNSDNTGVTASKENAIDNADKIIINDIDGVEADKMNINLSADDYVKMTVSELNDYYGMDIFPTVPSDLVSWDKADDFNGYGIWRRDGGTGEVYWDQSVLNYSNTDFTRSVNVEVAKGQLPVMDFGVSETEAAKSVISNTDVYLGRSELGYFQARFICNDTGFVITTEGLSQDEVIEVIRSVIE